MKIYNKNYLFYAIRTKNYSDVVDMVNNGIDINSISNCPALTSAIYNDIRIAKFLIKNGADFELDLDDEDKCYQPIYYLISSKTTNKFVTSDIIDRFNKLEKWIQLYSIQEIIIKKNLKNIFVLEKYNLVNLKIKEKYKHLFTANEINLL